LIKCILIVQGKVILVLQVCIHHVFIKLNLSTLSLSHFLSPAYCTVHYITFICRWIASIYFILKHFLFFTHLPPITPSDGLTKTILFYHYIYVYIYVCIHTHIWSYMFHIYILLIGLASTYERKHVTFEFLSLAYFV
jgi:hypothetical protein